MPELASYAPGTPCWVDVTSTDLGATNAFYGGLFGWRAESPGDEANGYTMYTLGGRKVAAASPPAREGAPPHWTTYLASDDAEATATKVRDAGGTVLVGPLDVLDRGRMLVAADPAGAAFGVWQAGTHVGAELVNEPGAPTWNDCRTPDPAGTAGFYAAVFPYTVVTAEQSGAEFLVLLVDGRGVAGVARPREGEPPGWRAVFSCADCDATVAKARDLGGGVLVEPFDIADVGRYAVVRDPLGAIFGVLA